jgi:hypothetical protein
MKRLGRASTTLTLGRGASLVIAAPLEVSLDCPVCQRRHRTAVFSAPGAVGRCTPSGHPFPGVLLRLEVRGESISSLFSYEYTPFVDAKYPDECHYAGFERGAPTWVRFNFVVTCGCCGARRRESTQSNICRPWTKLCGCGTTLYEDNTAPSLSWTELRGHDSQGARGSTA